MHISVIAIHNLFIVTDIRAYVPSSGAFLLYLVGLLVRIPVNHLAFLLALLDKT